MTDEERKKLCERLRRLDLERDVGVKAADEIERLNLELRQERDVRAEAERGCVNMAKEIERLAGELKHEKLLRLSERYPDVPLDQLAEQTMVPDGPLPAYAAQSDAEPVAWHWNSKLEGWVYTSDADDPGDATWRNLKKRMNMGMEKATAALAQSDAEPVQAFAKAVLHGDDEHKAWLLEAAGAFIAGNPLPAPRGKGAAPPRPDVSAEPVAWQFRELGGEWQMCDAATDVYYRTSKYEMRPLYAAPPRPDAPGHTDLMVRPETLDAFLEANPLPPDVSAGLIEAAEMAEKEAPGWPINNGTIALQQFARKLRFSAAAKSTPTWTGKGPMPDDVQGWPDRSAPTDEADADRPLGFRTNDVPNPYAEGPYTAPPPKPKPVYCLGWNTINYVREHGTLETENVAFIAASDLLHDPRPDASAGLDIDAAVKAGLVWRNPAPDAAPSAHSNTKIVTVDGTAPPRPDVSAEPVEAAEWLDTAASRFEEASDALRSEYKIYAQQLDRWAGDTRQRAKSIRARAADRSGK